MQMYGDLVQPLAFDKHSGFLEKIEYIPIEQLVPRLADAALEVSFLPRALRIDRQQKHRRDGFFEEIQVGQYGWFPGQQTGS